MFRDLAGCSSRPTRRTGCGNCRPTAFSLPAMWRGPMGGAIVAHLGDRLGRKRMLMSRVKEYIEANLEEDLSITPLAKVASLSRFHFARTFKTAVGQSPHQYVSAHRLERAKEMLMRGDQPLL